MILYIKHPVKYAIKYKKSIIASDFIKGAKNYQIKEHITIKIKDLAPIKYLLYLSNRKFEYESNNIGAKMSL